MHRDALHAPTSISLRRFTRRGPLAGQNEYKIRATSPHSGPNVVFGPLKSGSRIA